MHDAAYEHSIERADVGYTDDTSDTSSTTNTIHQENVRVTRAKIEVINAGQTSLTD